MKPRLGSLGDTLERLLPFLAFVVVVTAGWFWFIQPRLAAYLRTRTDTAALEERARTLMRASNRLQPLPPVDLGPTLREFETRVSADDKVADVTAALAQAVLASAPADKLRSFVIETGDRASLAVTGGSSDGARAPGGSPGDPDPRLALFPYSVSYTPVRLTFDSTFETAGDVLWRLRDLPTIVEVRSAALTRGLPLMKTVLLCRVWQRGASPEPDRLVLPPAPVHPTPGSTAPRLAPDPAGTGAPR